MIRVRINLGGGNYRYYYMTNGRLKALKRFCDKVAVQIKKEKLTLSKIKMLKTYIDMVSKELNAVENKYYQEKC